MVFRTQWLLTGGGLLPWRRDAHFLAGMMRYLQVGGSGVGNLTLNGWLPFNLTQTPLQLPTLGRRVSGGRPAPSPRAAGVSPVGRPPGALDHRPSWALSAPDISSLYCKK